MVAEVGGHIANPQPPTTCKQALGVGIGCSADSADLCIEGEGRVIQSTTNRELVTDLLLTQGCVASSDAFPLSVREGIEHAVVRVH